MRRFIAILTAALALIAGSGTATASEWRPPWNPGGVDWPANYRQLPKQPPYATFSNLQNTVRCGVYEFSGQTFIQCISLVDRMPGHPCNGRYNEANSMNSVTGDAWGCLPKNSFQGAPPMLPLQFRHYGNQFVFSDLTGNFYIGDRGLNRVIRVGVINDLFIDNRQFTAFNSILRGIRVPVGSSV